MDDVSARDFLEQLEIAQHQVRLGGDAEAAPAARRKNLQDFVCHREAPLGGLIGIGGGSDGDPVLAADSAQFGGQRGGEEPLGEDLPLEGADGVELHELVRVAGVAVEAAEFAAAVRIDGPLERHAPGSAIEEAAGRKLEVFDGAFGGEEFAGGGKPGDADEVHGAIFAFYSPSVNGNREGELRTVEKQASLGLEEWPSGRRRRS